MNNKIYAIELKERELEKQLLEVIKKENLTEVEFNKINDIKKQLKELQDSKKQIMFEEHNWECSHSYKSVNGEVKEVFTINNKEVSKEEYLKFVNKQDKNEFVLEFRNRPGISFNPFFWW